MLKKEIKRLKELNTEEMLKAMLIGDRSSIDYAHGFEDALTNIYWILLSEERSNNSKVGDSNA